MGRLFGTDGVRGIANEELTPELAFRLGRAGAAVLAKKSRRPKILVGRDTRISGQMLEASLTAGIASVGADVMLLGVLPTPGVAYLTKLLEADAGVMISASHNPVEDNGIKFFAGDGFKLPDEVEDEIEQFVVDQAVDSYGATKDDIGRPTGADVGRVSHTEAEVDKYVRHALSTVDVRFDGMKVVVDCANGAAFSIAPRIYRELGAEVVVINGSPDGTNINSKCGSTHPEAIQAAVIAHGADMGLAHDGDSDRVISVNEKGEIADGDYIMTICGMELMKEGKLPKKTIVATAYSNLGLSEAFNRVGGSVLIAKNGDRYVLEEMKKNGLVLGGEQSGHIIFLNHNTTGDGIITALQLMMAIRKSGGKLSEMMTQMRSFPQVLKNIKVADKDGLDGNTVIEKAVAEAESTLKGRGRIFVRASGTEPKVRVMVEGPDREECEALAGKVALAISRELG